MSADMDDLLKMAAYEGMEKELVALRQKVKDLDGAGRACDERLIRSAERANVLYTGCDTAAAMADEIVGLRIKLLFAENNLKITTERDKLRIGFRDEIAIRAMEAMLRKGDTHDRSPSYLREKCYAIADAFIVESARERCAR